MKKNSKITIRWTTSMMKKWIFIHSGRRKRRRGTRNGGIRSKGERKKLVTESSLLPKEIIMDTLSLLPVKSILRFRKIYAPAKKQKLEVDHSTSEVQESFNTHKEAPKGTRGRSSEPFVPLTEVEESQVSFAFAKFNRQKILVTHQNSNIEITGQILQCLKPGGWLNDEVINVYFGLLKEREQREPKKFLKCHFFNTFFYTKLISARDGYDFKSVRRWTTERKIGYRLLECDKIFVPIHKHMHWCLAVINKKDRKFQYLDSLQGMDHQVLKDLARYYMEEVKDKSGEDINTNSWTLEYAYDIPHQENKSDCGMFMIKYADFYSRGVGLCFSQLGSIYVDEVKDKYVNLGTLECSNGIPCQDYGSDCGMFQVKHAYVTDQSVTLWFTQINQKDALWF
ncbi:putative ubiquitin-like-specific protease 1B isoform X2 [Papaver somniferum]|uniref:putative ubiquitin-like-specific protease 1B isoform X2 n=1 Tax=Papaver somniferum TaxID=3469 RepID=UPI000E70387F|nr:putative ubiquitin-like-specific protease 1B isoform X2 [Papaver somniferum]